MSDLWNPGRHWNAGTHQAREAYCSRMYLSVVVRTPLCVDVELATSGVEESRPAGGHAAPLFKVQFQPISWRRRERCRAEDGGTEVTTADRRSASIRSDTAESAVRVVAAASKPKLGLVVCICGAV